MACLVAEPQCGFALVEGNMMRHKLKIHVSSTDTSREERVVGVDELRLPRRLARRIFGGEHRVAVLLPGVTVDEVTIVEHDDLADVAEAVGVMGGGSK